MSDADGERRRAEGVRIRQARRQLGLTIDQDIKPAHLARLLSVQASTVKSWEDGEKAPNDTSRAKLSALLGVTEAYLRYGIEPREVPGWQPPKINPPAPFAEPLQAIPNPHTGRSKKAANDRGRKRRDP
jgi:transcriptional regulator with XRE-family HTH domain